MILTSIVEMAIISMKNEKAAGLDNVKAEFFKLMNEGGIKRIAKFLITSVIQQIYQKND